jgi:hypothetical protein
MMNAKQELFEKHLREKVRLKNERKRLADQRISNEKRFKTAMVTLERRRIEMENSFKVRTAFDLKPSLPTDFLKTGERKTA